MGGIVAGIYKQGRIELLETPAGIKEGRVRVVLIEDEEKAAPQLLTFGKYQTGTPSTLEDFQTAEWRDEEQLDDLYGK